MRKKSLALSPRAVLASSSCLLLLLTAAGPARFLRAADALNVQTAGRKPVALKKSPAVRRAAPAGGRTTNVPRGTRSVTLSDVGPPGVVSVKRAHANPALPNQTVAFQVAFSVDVTGVDASDFALTRTGASTSVAGREFRERHADSP